MFQRLALTLILLAGLFPAATGAAFDPNSVPEDLRDWVPWVLHELPQRGCPFVDGQFEQRDCLWPTRLELSLNDRGGNFTAQVHADAEVFAILPGDANGRWPIRTEVDGKPALIGTLDGRPVVRIGVGSHTLSGSFEWERLPESLPLPRNTGLIALTVRGSAVAVPRFNDNGDLWLEAAANDSPDIVNTLKIRVFRHIGDGVPVMIVTRMDLDVAGAVREVVLQGSQLPGTLPLLLNSSLPARIEAGGTLRVQLRPGRWQIDLQARAPGPVESLGLPAFPEPWPAEEIWSFQPMTEVRVVEVGGTMQVDPSQTDVPAEWRNIPAYRLEANGKLELHEQRRGDPLPEPDNLSLTRQIWLDFDGAGFSFADRVTGRLSRDWRLDAAADHHLGRVTVNDQPQLISTDGSGTGVELRQGQLVLMAESRADRAGKVLSVSGWQRDFQQVSASLQLPPGWRLLAAFGVDQAPGAWISLWTLLDLFLVLVATLAVGRLFGLAAGGLAFAALVLLWHEPGAPRLVWLNLLAAAALLRVLPDGRIARSVKAYRALALLGLIIIAIPFTIEQVRLGIYPQLERPWQSLREPNAELDRAVPEPMMADQAASMESIPEYMAEAGKRMASPQPAAAPPARALKKEKRMDEIDPSALIQTGTGTPAWKWYTIALRWNGPVTAGQDMRLILISPLLNLLLNLLRVALLFALIWHLLREAWSGDAETGSPAPASAEHLRRFAGLTVLLCAVLAGAPVAKAADFPPPELLQQLKSRVTEPPKCLPGCAQMPLLALHLRDGLWRMRAEIHALETLAVPLPAAREEWLPLRVTVDGEPAESLLRGDDGRLWLGLSAGRHVVELDGPPPRGQALLGLPLRPARVTVDSEGWQVVGIGENGLPEAQLQLSRIMAGTPEAGADSWETGPLPPFLQVERRLVLGQQWRVYTNVQRVSPADAAIVVEIPLLEGESVVTPGLTAKNGKVTVNLIPGQGEFGWESIVAPKPEWTLKAASTDTWTEVWYVEVSPAWHLEMDGIPVTGHRDNGLNWRPQWQPWPGESVTLKLHRPAGAPGETLTIDRSRLEVQPGERSADVHLSLSVLSSQGGQHLLHLPEGAELRDVRIDGVSKPIRQQGRELVLPIAPSRQDIALDWHEPAGTRLLYRSAQVDLGKASINTHTKLTLGLDRWVLLAGGAGFGPAILFWGMVIVLIALAFGLGRVTLTPLRFRHWLLLLIGLSQAGIVGGIAVVGWLLGLGWRARQGGSLSDDVFKLVQISLALLTLLAFGALFAGVEHGLLGLPDMQVAGNLSDAHQLNWFQDRSDARLPQAWVLSLPLWTYRVLMLLWALWIAYALLDWLRWGWNCYSTDGLWRASIKPKIEPPADKPDPWTQDKAGE